MLVHIEEYGTYAEITGFRGVQIDDPKRMADLASQEKRRNTTVQFLNAGLIATWEHLYFAVLDALLAFRSNCNISKSLGVEIMLYASAQRQIRKAINLIGMGCGSLNLAVAIVGENKATMKRSLSVITEHTGKAPDESVLGFSGTKAEEVQRVFGISETEISAVSLGNKNEALVKLVIERMALLATKM